MKPLRQFLLEFSPFGLTKVYNMVRGGCIPVYPKMLTDVLKTAKPGVAYHITDFKGLVALGEIQETKKQISCFDKPPDYERAIWGIETKGGIVAVVKGVLGNRGTQDLFTITDNYGTRWIKPHAMESDALFFTQLAERLTKEAKQETQTKHDYIKAYIDKWIHLFKTNAEIRSRFKQNISGGSFGRNAKATTETIVHDFEILGVIIMNEDEAKSTAFCKQNYYPCMVANDEKQYLNACKTFSKGA